MIDRHSLAGRLALAYDWLRVAPGFAREVWRDPDLRVGILGVLASGLAFVWCLGVLG